jgi:hypothetical protein
MRYQYYVAGEGFDDYEDAVFYADVMLAQFNEYHAVFTQAEILASLKELVE